MKYAKFALAFAMCALCGLAVVWLAQSSLPATVGSAVGNAVCPYIGSPTLGCPRGSSSQGPL